MDIDNIRDRENFEKYQKKRGEWEKLLVGDEHHAIQDQIHSMIWDDLIFRIFNEAQKIGSKNSPSCSQNELLAFYMARSYTLGQGISLRKLTEKNPRDKNKRVVSLRRILEDIRNNQELVTREVYVSFDGTPYDSTEVVSRRGVSEACSKSQSRHRQFDILSGVNSQSRCRYNRIDPSIFNKIESWINECNIDDLNRKSNKYLAHAADDVSRSKENFEGFSVKMNLVSNIHCAMVQVFRAICDCIPISPDNLNVIPLLTDDSFENLDKPFVKLGMMSELSQLWDDYTKEREAWCSNVMEKLVSKTAEKECQVDEKDESSGA